MNRMVWILVGAILVSSNLHAEKFQHAEQFEDEEYSKGRPIAKESKDKLLRLPDKQSLLEKAQIQAKLFPDAVISQVKAEIFASTDVAAPKALAAPLTEAPAPRPVTPHSDTPVLACAEGSSVDPRVMRGQLISGFAALARTPEQQALFTRNLANCVGIHNLDNYELLVSRGSVLLGNNSVVLIPKNNRETSEVYLIAANGMLNAIDPQMTTIDGFRFPRISVIQQANGEVVAYHSSHETSRVYKHYSGLQQRVPLVPMIENPLYQIGGI